jgi:L-ascorbate metabolism protein UlaG (beta-lactamase superfamily)
VGFVVTVGGLRVLHVGDADPTPTNYTPHRLDGRRIDVAIVPFWYLTDRNDAVRRAIGARRWIATHIPPADAEAIRRQVLEAVPGAVVLIAPGERHSLP